METNDFRKQVKYILKEKGMTQRDLAEKLGCREQQVSNILNGRGVSHKMIVRLAVALGVTPADLMGDFSNTGASYPIVIFAYYNGVGKIPKNTQELFPILKEWQSEQFLRDCISSVLKALEEMRSISRPQHEPETLSLMDELAAEFELRRLSHPSGLDPDTNQE